MTFHCSTIFNKEKKVGHGSRLEPKMEISLAPFHADT
jgi:hypothetical protein